VNLDSIKLRVAASSGRPGDRNTSWTMGGTAEGSDWLTARRCKSLRFFGQSEHARCMMPFLFGKRLET